MAKRAFTYIELSVVVVLLLVAAAAITPSVVRMKSNRVLSDFKNGLPGLAAMARETAITRGSAVDLQFDENARQMQIVAPSSQDSGGTGPIRNASGITLPTDTTAAPITTAALPPGVEGSDYKAPPESTTTVAWSVRFYPDGTAAPAGIAFTLKDETYSLVIDAKGGGTLVTGGIPDLTATKWQAGDYVHRTQ